MSEYTDLFTGSGEQRYLGFDRETGGEWDGDEPSYLVRMLDSAVTAPAEPLTESSFRCDLANLGRQVGVSALAVAKIRWGEASVEQGGVR